MRSYLYNGISRRTLYRIGAASAVTAAFYTYNLEEAPLTSMHLFQANRKKEIYVGLGTFGKSTFRRDQETGSFGIRKSNPFRKPSSNTPDRVRYREKSQAWLKEY